ncbi:SPOR domain-containing protein [Salinisphaera sp. Q1T1-3]|uniref:SPOR domain-containing protein n=1 Tax=Salinisphaera sp. Q1T1-3 TaxID=2321229 RepID=UPI000E712905|nr:SPOR domain-containing protein [Salinisphaera sp. Q1T1-3]RJS95031.1 hypothetical protein D3260_00265 [Salinisphaera sp. Q1T1-3]
MNDVMKKRLIGVVVLVAIGVLVPVLLARCMGDSGQKGDRGQMRVYNVQPDGQAAPADNQAQSGDQGENDNDGQSTPRPDAVSPQRDDSASSDSGSQGFSTPPVHGSGDDDADSPRAGGNQGASRSETSQRASTSQRGDSTSQSSSAGRSSSRESQSSTGRSSSASNDTASSRNRSSDNTSTRRNDGGHDYGASTQGSSAQQADRGNASSSTSNNASSQGASGSNGLERARISGWVVQVASFSERSNAERMAKSLSGNYTASYTPGDVNGKTLYRVNVGPFDNESAARSAESRLKQQGHNGLVRNLP